jgi:hypothetical protein
MISYLPSSPRLSINTWMCIRDFCAKFLDRKKSSYPLKGLGDPTPKWGFNTFERNNFRIYLCQVLKFNLPVPELIKHFTFTKEIFQGIAANF